MLVLTRKVDERIVLSTPEGRRIVVMVVEIAGSKTRLGVSADDDVRIDRHEVDARRAAA